MTTPDETLHFSDDEREVFRLRAKVAALEVELSVQRKATGDEMGKREGMEKNWDQMVRSNREHVDRAEYAEARVREMETKLAAHDALTGCTVAIEAALAPWRAKVATLEECNRLSNESALQSAGRIRELEGALRAVVDAPHEPEGRFDRAYLDACWQRARAVLKGEL